MKIFSPINICILISLIFYSCHEIYTPDDLDNNKKIPVVDAKIIEGEKCEVTLLWASGYNTNDYLPIINAYITITDNEGNIIELSEAYKGFYQSSEIITGGIGKKYSLRIVTDDNSVYESGPELMEECPKIDTLYAEMATNVSISYNYYKEMMISEVPGLKFYLDTKFESAKTKYFRYETRIITQWFHYIGVDSPSPTPVYCWFVTNLFTDANIYASMTDESNQVILNRKMGFGGYKFNTKPQEKGESVREQRGWLVTVTAYNISKTAYNYYKAINNQINAEEKIFDPVPSQLTGNLKCTSDTTQIVLGLFEVASKSRENAAFHWATGYSKHYTKPDVYTPEFLDDNCLEGEKPEFWVDF